MKFQPIVMQTNIQRRKRQNQFECQLLTAAAKVERRAKHVISNILLFYELRQFLSFRKHDKLLVGQQSDVFSTRDKTKKNDCFEGLDSIGPASSCMLGYGTFPQYSHRAYCVGISIHYRQSGKRDKEANESLSECIYQSRFSHGFKQFSRVRWCYTI